MTLTDQQPANAAAVIDLDATTITDLWNAIFESDHVRAALARSLADLFGGLEPIECYEVLEDYGVPFWIRSHIVDVARGYASDVVTMGGAADARRVVDEVIAPLPDTPLKPLSETSNNRSRPNTDDFARLNEAHSAYTAASLLSEKENSDQMESICSV